MSAYLAWTLAEIGRVALTHALDAAPLAAVLNIKEPTMVTLIATGELPGPLPVIDQQIAAYVLNILVRLEVRCGGDSSAIRNALGRPSRELAETSIAAALLAGPDLTVLAAIRAAAGQLLLPRVKLWRKPDTYS